MLERGREWSLDLGSYREVRSVGVRFYFRVGRFCRSPRRPIRHP